MQHLALYRKYRPKTFDEVIGQEHIVKTLINQINNNTISHAYLFCGPRGNGKTSCAKIFARAINCLNKKNGSPCNDCENCKTSNDAGNLDIIEIDAASNNRVEEIRDIREKINFVPTNGKYKVYIVDEVHMLTDSAFNALLKTLEEPPSYAVFILCTTEVYKLPATILSRCTRFDFKLISVNDLKQHLKKVLNDSNITYDEESLELIARAGQGSVRDTLSVAEMCYAFCNNNLSYNEVIKCLGMTSNDILENITNLIIEKDAGGLLKLLDDMYKSGKNLNLIIKDLSEYMNNVLKAKLVPNAQSVLNYTQEDYNKLYKIASKVDVGFIIKCLEKFAMKETSIKLSLNPTILIQTTLLSCIVEDDEINKLKTRLDELEKKSPFDNINVNKIEKKTKNLNIGTSSDSFRKVENVDFPRLEENKEKTKTNAKKVFGEICTKLKENKCFMLYSACSGVKDVQIENNNLIIYANNECYTILKENIKTLQEIVNDKQKNIEIIIKNAINNEQNFDIIQLVKKIFKDNISYVE